MGNLPFTIKEPGFCTTFISVEDQTESSPVFVKCFEVESVTVLELLLLLLLLLSARHRSKEENLWMNWKEILILQIVEVNTWHFSKQFPLNVSSKILFQPKYFLGMLIRSRSSYQEQLSWLKNSYLFLDFFLLLSRDLLKYSTESLKCFQKHCKTQVGREKQWFPFSLPIILLNCSTAFALRWPMEEPGIQWLLVMISCFTTCGCRVYITTRQDNSWSSRKKKSSPMISLTSLFCHRLIQNSFQVTSTVLQSGNVLAATKGTSVWASALPAGQAAARSQPGILRSQPSLLPQMACSLERNTICRTQAPRDSLSTGANRQCSANLRQPKVSGCREFIYNSAAVRREQH